MKRNTLAIIALAIGAIALVLGAANLAAMRGSASDTGTDVTTFSHAEITPDQITLVPSGAGTSPVGDVRYYKIPATSPAGGLLTGTLTVTAVGAPAAGQELRQSNLVFAFGSTADQMVVGGEAVYDSASPALRVGDVITRPILGGTGTFAGATGWVETTHLEDGTWNHTFTYTATQ